MTVSVAANKRRQRGATLIEVLIAGALLLIMMAGILPAFVVAMNNNHKSKLDSTGIMLAQSVLEQIIALESGGGPDTVKDGLDNVHTINYAPGGKSVRHPTRAASSPSCFRAPFARRPRGTNQRAFTRRVKAFSSRRAATIW